MKKKRKQLELIPHVLTYEKARQILIETGSDYAEILKNSTVEPPTPIKIFTKKLFGRRKQR